MIGQDQRQQEKVPQATSPATLFLAVRSRPASTGHHGPFGMMQRSRSLNEPWFQSRVADSCPHGVRPAG